MSTTARTPSGDIQLPRAIVTDTARCVLQTVRDGLALWSGEWFLDQNAGFPWVKIFGAKIVDATGVSALLRQYLLSVPGIVSVSAVSTFSRAARQFSYVFSAQLNNGQSITGGSATPFQVTGAP